MPFSDSPNIFLLIIYFIATFIVSYIGVGLFRRLAIRFELVDKPNSRSSHIQVTPRGGGVILLLIYFASLLIYEFTHTASLALCLYIPLVFGVVGAVDDMVDLSARLRLFVYFVLSCIVVALLLEDFSSMSLWLLLAILFLWLVNLYNFMDGINGLASFQAIFVLLGALYLNNGAIYLPVDVVINLVAAICGFVVWNFPVAKVFLGDVGSIFIGALLAVLAFSNIADQGISQIFTWLILLGVFLIDATYTLCIRIITGQNIFSAHRSHSYQIIARFTESHAIANLWIAMANLFWLLPMAWLASRSPSWHWVLIAYCPLIFSCWWLGAGLPKESLRVLRARSGK